MLIFLKKRPWFMCLLSSALCYAFAVEQAATVIDNPKGRLCFQVSWFPSPKFQLFNSMNFWVEPEAVFVQPMNQISGNQNLYQVSLHTGTMDAPRLIYQPQPYYPTSMPIPHSILPQTYPQIARPSPKSVGPGNLPPTYTEATENNGTSKNTNDSQIGHNPTKEWNK